MVIGLLWIFGIYGFCAGLLHLLYELQQGKQQSVVRTHFVLITKNNQTHIEWYLRSLLFFSWVRSRQVTVTVFDDGSTDDTLDILVRMARGREEIIIHEYMDAARFDQFMLEHEDEPVICVNLAQGVGQPLVTPQW